MNRTDADGGSDKNLNTAVQQGNSNFFIFFSQPVEDHVKKKISTELLPYGRTEFPEFTPLWNPGNAPDLRQSNESSRLVAIADRQISPDLIQMQTEKQTFHRVVLINPEFRSDVGRKLHLLEIPVLIISSAELNWALRSQAISYHDLISGSEMVNVRSSAIDPLLELKSQVFNAIIKFERNAF